LETSVEISQLIVDNLDERIATINNMDDYIPSYQPLLNSASEGEMIPDNKSEKIAIKQDEQIAIKQDVIEYYEVVSSKLKVFELARELDMSSKSLIALLNDMGFKINHHMSALDENVIHKVKSEVLLGFTGVNKDMNSVNQHLSLVSRAEVPHEEMIRNDKNKQQPEASLGFSIEELKAAHPYLAVKTLFEQGLSVQEIAKMLDRGQGEVSLILNLTRKKQACI
ncbi:MAG: translation initiation factor IF-2 N-terminal domain-containing protein, partial [Syntrophomonadaceae bacterium]|nr:translation initiation factor IF-2 N-terminal domain-containing protein [Syntrophomonadaceae bacterium]